jgi:hypothetical protein
MAIATTRLQELHRSRRTCLPCIRLLVAVWTRSTIFALTVGSSCHHLRAATLDCAFVVAARVVVDDGERAVVTD